MTATATCDGYGNCFEQKDMDLIYSKSTSTACSHDCKLVKCPNFKMCGHADMPKWLLMTSHGVCRHCDMCFGPGKKLKFPGLRDCVVCMTNGQAVEYPNCSHTTCVTCFKRSWWGPELQTPPFPYPEREDEYDDTPDMFKNDPAVVSWERLCDVIYDEHEENVEMEGYLRKCPMCRL